MTTRTLRLLQELDWKTRLRRVKHRDHWRVYLIASSCTLLAYPVWHMLFPDTLWFYKLWGAVATGGILGSLVGYAWQLSDASRRAGSSGRHLAWSVILGFGVLTPCAIFLLAPILHSEELELAKIRSVRAIGVATICVQVSGEPDVKVVDRASIISFVNKCRGSKLFYPSHERSTNEFCLTVDFVDGSVWTYDAGIPEKHQADIDLSFQSYVGYSDILIPNGAKWLRAIKGPEKAPGKAGME